ncbi:bile acid:sodium symporter family protein [Baaleninema simplex]|uniref:bile acid:sodium symporter family protein n=1 Tax=Baaleninema simplex TaxID=2862350 RepID=UPI000348C41C|nr:bile acid:sodium symporter [Baaleninema simplex]
MLIVFLSKLLVVFLMLSFSFELKPRDIFTIFDKTHLVVRSILLNFLIIPTITLLIMQGFMLPQNTIYTLLLVSIAPGAPLAPKLATLAGGDLALAIGLTFVLSSLAIVIAPSMVFFLYSTAQENIFVEVLPIVIDLILLQLLPLTFGLFFNHCYTELATKFAPIIKIASDFLFLVLLLVVLSNSFNVFFDIKHSSLAAIFLFNSLTLIGGWLIAGTSVRDRKTLAVTTNSRNLALVLVIAVSSFPNTSIEAYILVFGVIELIFTLLAVLYFRCTFKPKH